MTKRFLQLLVTVSCIAFASGATSAEFKGGIGGATLEVTRLDDDVNAPKPGMLRWALLQPGPRVVKFKVSGTISLLDQVRVEHGRLTVDGSTAPGMGVCVRGGSLEFLGAEDVIIRYIRVRLGDKTTRRLNREEKRKRPTSSGGLDCLNFVNCRRIWLDHVSASWSCDEILSLVHCRDVLIEWCLFSEPLADSPLHPYGDRHSYAVISSASTLTLRNCLIAHYVMRGPQFEANDMRRADRYEVKMVAERNVMFDYERSGIRYTTGPEDHQKEATGKQFDFRFLNNVFIPTQRSGPEIEAVTKHGVVPQVKVTVAGNLVKRDGRLLPALVSIDAKTPLASAGPKVRRQVTLTKSGADEQIADRHLAVLAGAGCSHQRDSYDDQIVRDVMTGKSRKPMKSLVWRGGWPDLSSKKTLPLARHLFAR